MFSPRLARCARRRSVRLRVGACLGAWAVLLPAFPLSSDDRPLDAVALMSEVRRLEAASLWPHFRPGEIPAAVFDGEDTYFFGFPSAPPGTHPSHETADVLVYSGRYPLVSGNRPARIDGVWAATSIPRSVPPAGGRRMSIADEAAVIIHEKFHVFQALRHPDWKPNDLLLLRYPPDSADMLALRRTEVECFHRAISMEDVGGAEGWARAALSVRGRRMSLLPPELAEYERNLQLLEGLAEYVEYRAGGRAAFDAFKGLDFAPAAVRELGYLEGRWLAELLDRFAPGWADECEEGLWNSLPQRLEAALAAAAAPERNLTEDELCAIDEAAVRDMQARDRDRKARLDEFLSGPGASLDFVIPNEPLRFEIFDPLTIEALDAKTILHRQWIIARKGSDRIEIIGRPCLTELDSRGHIRRILVIGIPKDVRVPLQRFGPLSVRWTDIDIRLQNAVVIPFGTGFRVLVR